MLTALPYIQTLGLIIAACWALHLFRKQQRFKRLQNLSALWKNFVNDESNFNLFVLMDEIHSTAAEGTDLSNHDIKTKLRYLALIEEVALYVENFEVDKQYARYLFQWHFYYVYQCSSTKSAFWSNIGLEEIDKDYWSKSRNLSKSFIPNNP
jgi:hypothetical protein